MERDDVMDALEPWVALSPQEWGLACQGLERSWLEECGVPVLSLFTREVVDSGSGLLSARLEQNPDIPPEAWAELVSAARQVVGAERGSLVMVEGHQEASILLAANGWLAMVLPGGVAFKPQDSDSDLDPVLTGLLGGRGEDPLKATFVATRSGVQPLYGVWQAGLERRNEFVETMSRAIKEAFELNVHV